MGDALVVTPSDDGERWVLYRPWTYEGNVDAFEVPAGFETDLASVPRLFWAVFPPHGKYTRAAVLHDWLYHTHLTSRADADGLFLRVMLEHRTRRYRAHLMYRAVRIFGARAWRRRGARAAEEKWYPPRDSNPEPTD